MQDPRAPRTHFLRSVVSCCANRASLSCCLRSASSAARFASSSSFFARRRSCSSTTPKISGPICGKKGSPASNPCLLAIIPPLQPALTNGMTQAACQHTFLRAFRSRSAAVRAACRWSSRRSASSSSLISASCRFMLSASLCDSCRSSKVHHWQALWRLGGLVWHAASSSTGDSNISFRAHCSIEHTCSRLNTCDTANISTARRPRSARRRSSRSMKSLL